MKKIILLLFCSVYSFAQTYEGVSNPIKIDLRANQVARPVITAAPAENTEEIVYAKPRYFALLIGINKYKFNQDGIVDLNEPINDLEKLREAIVRNYTFNDEHVFTLKNATRSEIIDNLELLSREVTPRDNLLIFYAGHGIFDANLNVGYWLPSDASMSSKANWLSNSVLRDYITGIKSKHTLLVSDACFSGSIFKTRSVESLDASGFTRLYSLPSRKAMTSGTLTTVPDQSKFMEYMVKRLNDNAEDFLTAKQLFFQIETAVINNTSNIPQYGTIQSAGDEGGDFIFIRRGVY